MAVKIYYQEDCNLALLEGKTIAIIGYGSQGHAHALNLKESGCNVIVGLYEGSKSWDKAVKQGFEVYTAAEAAKKADIIMILINDENLVDISFFDLKPIGIVHNNFGYRLCPSTNLDNSTYWLFLEIIKLVLKNKKKFYIRLDPFIEIPIKDYTPMAYKMTIHGKPLNWDRIRNLQNDDFGQFINEKEDSDYSITDYVWNVKKNEIHFTCEELPAIGNCTIRGSRYFHAIFNKDTGSIIHCDGAIRIYSESELADRMRFHVRSSDVRKVGKRVKIFQTNDSLTQEEFSHLVMSFFVWNQDVVSYFNT